MSYINEEEVTREHLWDEFESNLRQTIQEVHSVISRARYLGYHDLAEKMETAI